MLIFSIQEGHSESVLQKEITAKFGIYLRSAYTIVVFVVEKKIQIKRNNLRIPAVRLRFKWLWARLNYNN